jgi:hypothetical protein
MNWLVGSMVAVVGVVGVVALIGSLMPVAHVASRSAEFSKAPDDVFALIADPNSYPEWWDGTDVKTEVVERVPPSKLVTKIVDETQFGGTWTIEIAPTPAGSRMTVTERGEIYNVIFRALARYVFGYTGTMDSFLSAARAKLN